MPKYIYQPLDKTNSEFRLLYISKHPLIDLPQCSLQKYSLTDCPGYTALSYTWGKPTPTYRVAIEGANLEVSQNLFDFLDAYTTERWGMNDIEKPVFYWIDQICINQEDLVERSDQVSIMGNIYKRAKIVLIWLGHDPKMVENARSLRDNKLDGGWAIVTLLAHPYFSRIWIVQEILLSHKLPLIVCGGIELSLDRVSFAALQIHPHLPPVTFKLMCKVSTIGYARRRTLQECIYSHCEGNCHDPRDKVYGLLGLTPERWRVHVDYTKEVLEVYFDAAAALCEELFDLTDPECLYPVHLKAFADLWTYRNTLFILGRAMGLPQHGHRGGLVSFLEYIQAAYLSTKIRNVQYTYTGRTYMRYWAHIPSPGVELSPFYCECIASGTCIDPTHRMYPQICSEKVEVNGESITVTRRNPLLRDIIPVMGLQLASTTAESTDGQSGDSVPVRDRWWCKNDGEIHYFDCPDEDTIPQVP